MSVHNIFRLASKLEKKYSLYSNAQSFQTVEPTSRALADAVDKMISVTRDSDLRSQLAGIKAVALGQRPASDLDMLIGSGTTTDLHSKVLRFSNLNSALPKSLDKSFATAWLSYFDAAVKNFKNLHK